MAFSIKAIKKVSTTGLRDALIKAVKKANPNLDVNENGMFNTIN